MDLEHDGLYRMYLVADVAIPTQKSQFISLVSLLEALYTVKVSNYWRISKIPVYYLNADVTHSLCNFEGFCLAQVYLGEKNRNQILFISLGHSATIGTYEAEQRS